MIVILVSGPFLLFALAETHDVYISKWALLYYNAMQFVDMKMKIVMEVWTGREDLGEQIYWLSQMERLKTEEDLKEETQNTGKNLWMWFGEA